MSQGLADDGHAYVLADYSQQALPDQWARVVLRAYWLHNANAMVVEVNQGGKMVRNTIEQANKGYLQIPALPIREVRAKQGKVTRAEPVSLLYEQGRVHHVGNFSKLEDQMTNFTIDFKREKAGYSPDRLIGNDPEAAALSAPAAQQ